MRTKNIIHPFYKNHPEHPYISPERDLADWEKDPERYPYGLVERKQMERLTEGILPGHIIMLWRINFNNFTNQSVIPQYFEYRYGVDSKECIQALLEKQYIEICSAKESLESLNMNQLKKILADKGLDIKGKKDAVLERIVSSFSESELAEQFELRKFKITSDGKQVLNKYNNIIKKHGTKK